MRMRQNLKRLSSSSRQGRFYDVALWDGQHQDQLKNLVICKTGQTSLDKPIQQSLPVIAVALRTARHHALQSYRACGARNRQRAILVLQAWGAPSQLLVTEKPESGPPYQGQRILRLQGVTHLWAGSRGTT